MISSRVLHPDIDPGVDWVQVALLDELNLIAQRLVGISALDSFGMTQEQRMSLMQARSAYANRARQVLTQLAESGFNEGGLERFQQTT